MASASFANGPLDRFGVDGFGEAGVDDPHFQSLGGQQIGGLDAVGQQRAQAEDVPVAAEAEDFGAAQFNRIAGVGGL